MKRRKKFKLPGIGMRNLKTVLSVLVCLIVYALLGNEMPFYACIAAVICMQDTVENTVRHGMSRLLGTFVGGVLGIVFLWLSQLFPYLPVLILLCGLGVCLAIYLGVLLNRPLSCTIASTVFLVIMLTHKGDQLLVYALNRILETGFGVVVAIVINRFINPKISHTDRSLKWSWKIARTDLLEGHLTQRPDFQREQPAEEADGVETGAQQPGEILAGEQKSSQKTNSFVRLRRRRLPRK